MSDEPRPAMAMDTAKMLKEDLALFNSIIAMTIQVRMLRTEPIQIHVAFRCHSRMYTDIVCDQVCVGRYRPCGANSEENFLLYSGS